jgi:hypothetical protein
MTKSRPTSSSSSFMYINLRFQPLDEVIKEEKEFGRNKRNLKSKKKKAKKNKRKVIRIKQNDSGYDDEDDEVKGISPFTIFMYRRQTK